MHRGLDDHAAEEVAASAAAHRFHALVAQAKDASRLRLRRDLQHHVPVERRHRYRAAERCGRKAQRHLARKMLAVALEDRVLAHVHLDVEIAGRAAVAAGLAFAGEAHAILVVDAGRDFHRQLARAAHAPLAEAGVAGVPDDGAGAAAARTGLLQVKEPLADAHLARAPAALAGRGLAALGGARAVAGAALGEL